MITNSSGNNLSGVNVYGNNLNLLGKYSYNYNYNHTSTNIKIKKLKERILNNYLIPSLLYFVVLLLYQKNHLYYITIQ